MAMMLSEARAQVFENYQAGIDCPCCDQFARLYKRKLNSGMAAGLVWLVLHSEGQSAGWVMVGADAPAWLLRAKELQTTRHWGLVEQRPKDNDDPNTRTSGIWRPTILGQAFVMARVTVPMHVYLYNNEVDTGWGAAGFSPEQTTITQALGARFVYADLMNISRKEAGARLAGLGMGPQLSLF